MNVSVPTTASGDAPVLVAKRCASAFVAEPRQLVEWRIGPNGELSSILLGGGPPVDFEDHSRTDGKVH